MRESRLRIVVTGLAATYPYGGVFWDYFQYVLGFKQLGHEVLYLEDTGKWSYDPESNTFVADGRRNAEYLARHITRLDPGLGTAWFFRDNNGNTYGRPWREVVAFCRTADLLLHISASCYLREEYLTPGTIAFIDTDPMFTQAGLLDPADKEISEQRIAWWRQHHHLFFTFGENIGQSQCKVPTGPFQWIPTRQPVVLSCFTDSTVPVQERRRVITTVASWEPAQQRPVYAGIECVGKSVEFLRFLPLADRSALPLELALSGPAPRRRLEQAGWHVVDAYPVSRDPWVYRDYLARSLAEFSVAKNAYVASRSGWFSCRSACYLALQVPVIVQDTGFSRTIPTGEGILTFSNLDQAIAAIEDLAGRYERHQDAARDIAHDYFDAKVVLTDLLRKIGLA